MQTKRWSLIESCVNVAIGYGVALVGQMIVFPMYGMEVSILTNLQIGLWFTLISIGRSYAVRRGFNWYHHHSPAVVAGARTNPVSLPGEGDGGRVT